MDSQSGMTPHQNVYERVCTIRLPGWSLDYDEIRALAKKVVTTKFKSKEDVGFEKQKHRLGRLRTYLQLAEMLFEIDAHERALECYCELGLGVVYSSLSLSTSLW